MLVRPDVNLIDVEVKFN